MTAIGDEMDRVIARFWSRVRKSERCWEWTGSTRSGGYGCLKVRGKTVQAHRFAWELEHGPANARWADGDETDRVCVSHRCGNSRCVRADHLYLVPLAEVRRSGRVKRAVKAVLPTDMLPMSPRETEPSERLDGGPGSLLLAQHCTGVSMRARSLARIDQRFTETLSALQSLQAALEETARQQRRIADDLAATLNWLRTASGSQACTAWGATASLSVR